MNWDAISAISEAIGVFAVLASIIYLARQVAQGNRLNESDSIRNFLGQYNTFLNQIGSPELVEIWRKGTTDFDSLTGQEKARLHTVFLSHYMLGQAQRLIDPDGEEELSKFADYMVAVTVRQPGVSMWWRTFKVGLPDQEYVERIDNYTAAQGVDWSEFIPWFTPDPQDEKTAGLSAGSDTP